MKLEPTAADTLAKNRDQLKPDGEVRVVDGKATEAVLRAQSVETLVDWWWELNAWGWPKKLPAREAPERYGSGRRRAIMDWIVGRAGPLAVARGRR